MEVEYIKGRDYPIVINFSHNSIAINAEDAAKLIGQLNKAIMADRAYKNGCCKDCGHGQFFELLGGEKKLRCWCEPSVCDHAFCISAIEAEVHTCENFITKDELEEERKEAIKGEIKELKERLKRLEEEEKQ
jgi:hypothetical protein